MNQTILLGLKVLSFQMQRLLSAFPFPIALSYGSRSTRLLQIYSVKLAKCRILINGSHLFQLFKDKMVFFTWIHKVVGFLHGSTRPLQIYSVKIAKCRILINGSQLFPL